MTNQISAVVVPAVILGMFSCPLSAEEQGQRYIVVLKQANGGG